MKVENHDTTSHLKFQKLGKKIRKTSKNFGHLYLIYFFLIFETSSDYDTTKLESQYENLSKREIQRM